MKVILVIGLLIVQAVWYGWVLHVLWSWFVVPTFAVAALTIPQALGLALMVRMLTYVYHYQPDTPKNAWMIHLAFSYFWPLFALGIGWVYTWFM